MEDRDQRLTKRQLVTGPLFARPFSKFLGRPEADGHEGVESNHPTVLTQCPLLLFRALEGRVQHGLRLPRRF